MGKKMLRSTLAFDHDLTKVLQNNFVLACLFCRYHEQTFIIKTWIAIHPYYKPVSILVQGHNIGKLFFTQNNYCAACSPWKKLWPRKWDLLHSKSILEWNATKDLNYVGSMVWTKICMNTTFERRFWKCAERVQDKNVVQGTRSPPRPNFTVWTVCHHYITWQRLWGLAYWALAEEIKATMLGGNCPNV